MTTSASEQFKTEFPVSISAMVLLNSSSQGVVETYIDQGNAGDWYTQVEQNLDAVQKLVRQWRLSGNLYFSNGIVTAVLTIANIFKDSNTPILGLFSELEAKVDPSALTQLISLIQGLQNPIQNLAESINHYNDQLNQWAAKIEAAHEDLMQTIGKVQQQEVNIAAEITATNTQIDLMKQQIAEFKKTIAQAESKRKRGIFETIFGVVLAPFTLGGSLILAGFGVSSIVEAESEVSTLQNSIQSAVNKISQDQQQLTQDQQQIACLNALLLSVGSVNDDCIAISDSLEALQTTVGSLYNEASNVVSDLTNATNSQMVILQKVWYMSAYNEWQDIQEVATTLTTAQPAIKKTQIQ